MLALIYIALLSAACFYLGSRALITRALWSRYPTWLAGFMDCPACTGFWYGLGWAITLDQCFGVFVLEPSSPLAYIVVGLMMIALTPIAAGFMQRGLDSIGEALPSPDHDTDHD